MAKLNINQITSSTATNTALLQSLKIPTAVVATPSTSGITLNWTDNNTHLGNKNTIVFIGSSTTYGYNSSDAAHNYVGLVTSWLNLNYKNQNIINYGWPGYTSYHLMPNGFVSSIASRPGIDTNRNITQAIAQNPNIIVMNIPTNDKNAGYDDQEYWNNLTTIYALAKDAGIKMFVTTTQPRLLSSSGDTYDLYVLAQKMITYFGNDVIDFYNGLNTTPDYNILPTLNSGDNTHFNNAGHAIIAGRVQAKLQPYIESTVTVTSKEVDIFNYSSGNWSANIVDRFATSYSVTGLTTGTTYGYQVSTKNLGYIATSKIGYTTILIPSATTVSGSTSGTTSGTTTSGSTVTSSGSTSGTTTSGSTTSGTTSTRILFDLGDKGQTTPTSVGSSNPGQNSDGLWWNNLTNDIISSGTVPITWFSSAVTTTNIPLTGFSMVYNVSGTAGQSPNIGGMNVQVGDYPASATYDNAYFVPNYVYSLNTIVPSGKTASIKFWGSRAVTDDTRHLQMKLSTDSVWKEMNAANNSNYNEAVIFTGLTGSPVIQFQVKSGSQYGYIGVMDVTLS